MNEENKDFSIEKFSPAKEQVATIIAEVRKADMTSEPSVHVARITLRDLRVSITKRGKELREGALNFQKQVIAKEKELVGMIEPDELRLEQAESEMKLKRQMEERKEILPQRIAALTSIDDELVNDENEILAMNDTEFNEYRLRRIDSYLTQKAEAMEQQKRDEAAAEARRKAQEEAEREAKQQEEETKLAAERAAFDKEKRIEEARIAAERAEIDKQKAIAEAEQRARDEEIARKEREEKLAKEKAEREAREKAEKEAEHMKQEQFQKWLVEITFDKSQGDILHTATDGTITAYRPIGIYKHT